MQSRFSSTVELLNVTLTLRDDLQISLQTYGDELCYLIEDEMNGRFYRIGIPEYTFISLLDGTTSIRDAMAQTAGVLGSDAFSQSDAAGISKWLIESQLAYSAASDDSTRLWERKQKANTQKKWQRINPLIVRLPLWRPERFVTAATDLLGWWFSWPAFALWMATLLAAAQQVVSHIGQLPVQSTHILAPTNLFFLLVSFCVMKSIHELSHGIACHKFGGHVREAGFLLIVMAPVPYVDVTSAWRFPSKYQRMLVSFAGMYTELFLAAIAAIIWVHAPDGILSQQAYNIMITASISTLVFNANPLMRFDGYYILADFVEIPNLYSLAQQYLMYLGRKYVAGVKARMPFSASRRRWFIRCYAIAAFVWRIVVSLSILLAAAVLFEGAGVVLAIAAGGAWVITPLYRLGRYLIQGGSVDRPNRVQFALVTSIAASLIALVVFLPEPFGITSPAIVVYSEPHVVRAPYDGFVQKVLVHDGDYVSAGTHLAEIENHDLELECLELRTSASQSEVHGRVYQNDDDLAARQAEDERRAAIMRTADEQESRLEKSQLTTPKEGIVVRRESQSLLGSYLEEGNEIMTIAREDHKEVKVYVAQAHIEPFVRHVGEDVQVLLTAPGFRRLTCRLQSMDPRAMLTLEEPALSAANGGPLAVRPQSETTPQEEQQSVRFDLLQPRFAGTIELTASQAEQLRAGQTASVRLGKPRGTIAEVLVRSLKDWIDKRLDAS